MIFEDITPYVMYKWQCYKCNITNIIINCYYRYPNETYIPIAAIVVSKSE